MARSAVQRVLQVVQRHRAHLSHVLGVLTMTNDKHLIEVAFPLKQVSLDSVHEKSVRRGYIQLPIRERTRVVIRKRSIPEAAEN